MTPRITILHTNDLHNHLTEAQAARLRWLRDQVGEAGLLLDAGDAVSSGNLTFRPGGEPILERMSDAGYDAMVVGNREFHFTQAGFHAKVRRARFAVLSANARPTGPGVTLPVVPSITRVLTGGVRVAVFGVTVPMITERMLARKVSACVFEPPGEAAAREARRLRPDCDLLICLSHAGLRADREIAAADLGIDLIVGGHSHAVLPEGEHIGGTLVVQGGSWGHYVGRVEVTLEEAQPTLRANLSAL